MGHGIAQVLAMSGRRDAALRHRGRRRSSAALERCAPTSTRASRSGKVDAGRATRRWRALRLRDDMEARSIGVDVVVEAVPEILELKRRIFRDLGGRSGPTCCWRRTPPRCRSPTSPGLRRNSRARGRDALLQPGPHHEAGRGRARRVHQLGGQAVVCALDLATPHGQGAHRRAGQRPDSPPRAWGIAIGLEAMRHGRGGRRERRGHRQGHDPRIRLPDGSAQADRSGRTRRAPGDLRAPRARAGTTLHGAGDPARQGAARRAGQESGQGFYDWSA